MQTSHRTVTARLANCRHKREDKKYTRMFVHVIYKLPGGLGPTIQGAKKVYHSKYVKTCRPHKYLPRRIFYLFLSFQIEVNFESKLTVSNANVKPWLFLCCTLRSLQGSTYSHLKMDVPWYLPLCCKYA